LFTHDGDEVIYTYVVLVGLDVQRLPRLHALDRLGTIVVGALDLFAPQEVVT
jgi:hypothetical protein